MNILEHKKVALHNEKTVIYTLYFSIGMWMMSEIQTVCHHSDHLQIK